MKKNLMFLVLMLLFVSTITFSQTIYSPGITSPYYGQVFPYFTNVPVVFDDYGNGLTPQKHYYFDIYLNNSFVSQQTTSPFTLIKPSPGIYTVTIILMYRDNTSSPFIASMAEMVTFYVAPTISVSSNVGNGATVSTGTSVTFTASVSLPSGMTIDWELYDTEKNKWVTVVGGNPYILPIHSVGMYKVRAHICVGDTIIVTSNEITVYGQ